MKIAASIILILLNMIYTLTQLKIKLMILVVYIKWLPLGVEQNRVL